MGGVARIHHLRRRRARGMAMVEMIFVLPVLLMLVFAIAEFSLMFTRWLTLITAVQEGARTAAVYRLPCNEDAVKGLVETTVNDYAQAGGIDPADLEIEVDGHCGGSGTQASVNANFLFTLHVPFASSLDPINIAYSSTLRNE